MRPVASQFLSPMPTTQVHADLKATDLGFTERRCQLAVLSGPETGRIVDVDHMPFTVGKGEECDLVLTEPTVSRTHFSIESEQGAFVIRDLSSTNGADRWNRAPFEGEASQHPRPDCSADRCNRAPIEGEASQHPRPDCSFVQNHGRLTVR